jgi:type I restriction enzyme, S subunit
MASGEFGVGDVLALQRRPVDVDPSASYREIGIRSFGRGIFHKEPVSGVDIAQKRIFYIHSGDLLFSNVFAWEGAVAIAQTADEGLVGSHRFMTYVVDESKADARYLRFYFAHGPGLEAIRAASPGSAGRNKTLGIDSFSKQRITIPELLDQRRIADKLDSMFNKLNAVGDLNSKVVKISETLKEHLVDSAIALDTDSTPIRNVLRLERSEVSIRPEGRYRTLGIRSFGRGLIHHPTVTGDELSKLKYFRFHEGCLALSNLMAWEGAITVTNLDDTAHLASNRFLFYKPIDERINVSFVRHFLLTRRGQRLISSACSSGAERNRTLGRQRFEALEIPLPPRAEQDRIATILDKLADRMQRAQANPAAAALQPAILNAAFTGQL